MWHDSSTAIPQECCIRENHWRGSLDDSFPVCVAILAAFSPEPSLREISRLCRFVEFHDSSADASQTSVSDNTLDVRGLLRLCVEKYWEVVEREQLCSCCKLIDKFRPRIVNEIRIVTYFFSRAKNDRKRDKRFTVLPATIFRLYFGEQMAKLFPFTGIRELSRASIAASSLLRERVSDLRR